MNLNELNKLVQTNESLIKTAVVNFLFGREDIAGEAEEHLELDENDIIDFILNLDNDKFIIDCSESKGLGFDFEILTGNSQKVNIEIYDNIALIVE